MFFIVPVFAATTCTDYTGLTYDTQTMQSSRAWRGIAWSSSLGCFVTAANGPTNVGSRSTDGVTWTDTTMSSSRNWEQVIWTGSNFIYRSGDNINIVATSPDGTNWTNRTLPATRVWRTVGGGNGRWIAFPTAFLNPVAYSDDHGVTWNAGNAPGFGATGCVWNGTIYIAAGAAGGADYGTSVDGSTWTVRTAPFTWSSTDAKIAVTEAGTVCVAGVSSGGFTRSATTTNGVDWTLGEDLAVSGGAYGGLDWNGTVFSWIESSGVWRAWISVDGLAWCSVPVADTSNWSGLAWGGGVGRFCSVGFTNDEAVTMDFP